MEEKKLAGRVDRVFGGEGGVVVVVVVMIMVVYESDLTGWQALRGFSRAGGGRCLTLPRLQLVW
jgi:hypothetical protein